MVDPTNPYYMTCRWCGNRSSMFLAECPACDRPTGYTCPWCGDSIRGALLIPTLSGALIYQCRHCGERWFPHKTRGKQNNVIETSLKGYHAAHHVLIEGHTIMIPDDVKDFLYVLGVNATGEECPCAITRAGTPAEHEVLIKGNKLIFHPDAGFVSAWIGFIPK